MCLHAVRQAVEKKIACIYGLRSEGVKKEYIRRVKKCLKSKLNGGNMVKAINTWAVSLMRYSAEIVEWTKADLDVTDRKTRKLMTMHGMLHPRSNVSRLYYRDQTAEEGYLVYQTALASIEWAYSVVLVVLRKSYWRLHRNTSRQTS